MGFLPHRGIRGFGVLSKTGLLKIFGQIPLQSGFKKFVVAGIWVLPMSQKGYLPTENWIKIGLAPQEGCWEPKVSFGTYSKLLVGGFH